MDDRILLARILAFLGAGFSLASGAFGVLFLLTIGLSAGMPGFLMALFLWIACSGLAGGALLLLAGLGSTREPTQAARWWRLGLAGAIVALLGLNALAGALGITGAVLMRPTQGPSATVYPGHRP